MDTRRDFIYVDDLIEVVEAALGGTGEGHYHVSSGLGLLDQGDVRGCHRGDGARDGGGGRGPAAPARGRRASILLDPSRTEKDFGWKAKTSLTDGVAKAIEWYQENGVGETYTHLKAEELKVSSD